MLCLVNKERRTMVVVIRITYREKKRKKEESFVVNYVKILSVICNEFKLGRASKEMLV